MRTHTTHIHTCNIRLPRVRRDDATWKIKMEGNSPARVHTHTPTHSLMGNTYNIIFSSEDDDDDDEELPTASATELLFIHTYIYSSVYACVYIYHTRASILGSRALLFYTYNIGIYMYYYCGV